jgi:polyhydroxybutyrate depolymerase
MTWLVRRRLALLALPLLAASTSTCAPLGGDVVSDGSLVPGFTTARHVQMGDWTRDYLLHVPRQTPYNLMGLRRRYPLLIVLHGSGARGETIRQQSGMDSVAEARRFLVAYPDGSGEMFGLSTDWNAGQCCGTAHFDRVNDIAFLRALIADVSSHLPVDARRIYIAGFSDGARMAYRSACEMAGEITAVAAVSGNLVTEHCQPSRAIPVIAFHGSEDDEVPYNDSAYSAPLRPPPPDAKTLPPTVRFWLATDGCRRTEARRVSAHVIRTSGVGCSADVAFYSIEGAGHGWPAAARPDTDVVGDPNEVSASSLIADFFLRHRL